MPTNPETARRAEISAHLWQIAEQHIVAEWICCEPLDPKHHLCAKGYAALGMAKTLLVDSDPEKAWNPAAPVLDAVMQLRATLMRAHVALAEQAGRDQAALARVRLLHDRLAEETDLTSPDDSITRGAAAKRIAAALDGWNPTGAPQCDVEFKGGGRCAKPVGHRPPGSDDPHVPAVGARQPDTETQPAWTSGPVAPARAAEWASQQRAATVDPAMCPRCKGDNQEAFELCPTCAAGGAGGVADETGEGVVPHTMLGAAEIETRPDLNVTPLTGDTLNAGEEIEK